MTPCSAAHDDRIKEMLEVGKEFWRSSGSTSLPNQGHLEQIALDAPLLLSDIGIRPSPSARNELLIWTLLG